MNLTERQKKILTTFVLAAISVISSIPLLSRTLLWGADLEFHLFRIEGIAQGLRDGQFPVFMQTVQVGGYGYPVSVMYGDMLLYIPALLHLMGLSTAMAYRLFAIFLNIVAVWSTYLIFGRIFQSRQVGMLSAALWTLCTYRLDDVYSRGAVGEWVAMLFFPILLLGVVSVVFPERRGSIKHGGLVCAFSATGIVTSHVISTELTVIAILPILIWAMWYCWHSIYFWKQLGIACGMTVVLSSFFLIPMLDYSIHGNFQVYSQNLQTQMELAARKAIEPGQLLTLFLPLNQMTEGHAFQGDIPYSIGWALIACALLLPIIALLTKSEENSERKCSIAVPLCVSIILGLFMTTTLFPWDSRKFADVCKFLYSIQFPTRMLGPACFLIVVLGAMGLYALRRNEQFGRLSSLVFSSLLILGCLEGGVTTSTFMYNAKEEQSVDASLATSSGVAGGEYLIKGTDLGSLFSEGFKAGKPKATEGVYVSRYEKRGTSMSMYIESSQKGTITLPAFAYDNYRISDSESNKVLNLGSTHGIENLLTIRVPKGFSGEVQVRYRVLFVWRVAEIISLLGWIGCGVLYAHEARFRRRKSI